MQYFRDVDWKTSWHEEDWTHPDGNIYKTDYMTIADWKIPFTFEEWAGNLAGTQPTNGPENIYEYCASKLTRPYCKKAVSDAATRLDLDPGFLKPYEKMASFYVLRLLAGIPYKNVWQEWSKVPTTDDMLKDEIFCLCVVALHPELYGKLHPIGRNKRRVTLEAIALWRLPKYSLMQFVHPNAMRNFGGVDVHPNSIGYDLQYHCASDKQYWLFDDPSVVNRVIGKSGSRRWFELEFVGPTAVSTLVQERLTHGNTIDPIRPFVEKNTYVTYKLPESRQKSKQ